MIKSQDKTSVPNRHSSCFAESDAASGIAFERSDGTKRFVPSSFLCTVDFHGANELVFRYTFGTIIVQGQALEPLWTALCHGTLARVVEGADELAAQDVTLIQAIVIKDDGHMPETPRFPSGS
jgi:hypothetical protein